jgi:hypothetical protein
MSNNQLEDWQLALLVESRRKDDPQVMEAAEAELFRDYKNQITEMEALESPTVVEREVKELHEETESLRDQAQSVDNPKVVEEDEWEALQESVDAAKGAFSEALKEHHDLRDSVVEAMSLPSMVSQFRDEDSDGIKLDSLAQIPEAGGNPDAGEALGENPDDDDDDEDPIESLSADRRREAREKVEHAERMADRTPKYAESLRKEVVNDILGLDDDDEIDPDDLSPEDFE